VPWPAPPQKPRSLGRYECFKTEDTPIASIVTELQADALNSNVRIPDLLRKALVIARKLQLTEFEEWVSRELEGYKLTRDVPPYRVIRGEVRAWNPYNQSWIPGVFEDPSEAERLSRRANGSSVSELEETLEESRRRGGQLQMPFDQATQAALMRRFNLPLIPTLVVSSTSLRHILDAVRTTVLNWALRLEADGIHGEGLTFSTQEREKVASAVYNIMNFYGGVSGSQVQQASFDSNQTMGFADATLKELLSAVEKALTTLPQLPGPEASKMELKADLQTLAAQAVSPRPSPTIIRESAKSARTILEGMAGSVLAAKLLEVLARLTQ
jgi:hypothetical protein